jgi:ribonuclease HI
MTKETNTSPALTYSGMVLYADAGVKPNPGFGGWGIHGYTFDNTVPKKGSGNPKAYVTTTGYVMREDVRGQEKPKEASVGKYIDGYGSIEGSVSNNAAEIVAATNAAKTAYNYDITDLTIYTDSSMVVKGSNGYVEQWINNGWLKADGMPVANQQHWLGLHESLNALKNKNISYSIKWIKGHNGNLGNETVDQYATMGRVLSSAGVSKGAVITSPTDNYWGVPIERPALLSHPCSYLTTAQTNRADPYEYFLGTHQKEDDTLGTRTSDGAYAYVVLKEPAEPIEMIKDKVRKHADRDDRLIMFSLNTLYNRDYLNRVLRFGEDCLYQPNPKKLSFFFPAMDPEKDTPFSRELSPPMIAIRAIEALATIKGVLLDYRENPDTKLVATDITEVFYTKNKKDENEIRPEITVGIPFIKVNVKHRSKDESLLEDTEVTLTTMIDLPDRNTLKRLDKQNPNIKVVTWKEGPNCFRYAVVIEADSGYGIWAGYYTNMVLMK